MKIRKIVRNLVRRVDGQDMIEYALIAGFLAVTAGATLPDINEHIHRIFKRTSKLVFIAAEGGRGPTSLSGTQQ